MNNQLITSCLENEYYLAYLEKRNVSDNFPQGNISSFPFFTRQNMFCN